MQELPINGFYAGESKKLSDRRCINWIPTPSDAGALSPMSLMPTSGIGRLISSQIPVGGSNNSIVGQVFGWDAKDDRENVYFATGSTLSPDAAIYSTSGSGFLTSKVGDTLGPNIMPRWAASPLYLVMVSVGATAGASSGSYIDNNDVLTNIDFTAMPLAVGATISDVAYIGGRFLYCSSTTEESERRCYYTDIGGVTPSGLDFFAPQDSNTRLTGIEVLNNRVYLFSSNKTFIFQLTSSTDIPFKYVGEIPIGLMRANEKCQYGGQIYLKGFTDDGAAGLFVISGGGISKVSTPAIDFQLSEYTNGREVYPSSTIGGIGVFGVSVFAFNEKGRDFICMRAIGANGYSFVLEPATGVWHERQQLDGTPWSVIGVGASLSSNGLVAVGSTVTISNGNYVFPVAFFDPDIGTEYGDLVERTMISAPFNDKNQRMMVDELQPQCEVDYSNPVNGWPEAKINLSMSHDFGNTFEQERGLNVGRAGNYTQETRFMSFGYVRQAFTVKLRSLNPYPTRVIRLLSRLTKGGA